MHRRRFFTLGQFRPQMRWGTVIPVVGLVLGLSLGRLAWAKNYNYNETEINQKDAGGYASNNYWNGSGDSKDEGVRNAMRAVNRLASLDIGGAMHYGYKGYGNYINSQRMDDLDNQNWKNKASMNSINANMLSSSSGSASGNSPFGLAPEREAARIPASAESQSSQNSQSNISKRKLSEMDRNFLYRGETGDVAAEFEKRSGMSREEFFDHLVAAEESGLTWDDPGLLSKFEQRYQAFVTRIPNKEFRANIEKMHSIFNLAKKTQLLDEGAAFYRKLRWGDGGGQVAGKAAEPQNLAAAGTDGKESDGDRSLASSAVPPPTVAGTNSEELPKLSKDQMGMYLGLDGSHGDELKDIIGPEDTIFRVVTNRYRKLTPMLLGKITVLNSK